MNIYSFDIFDTCLARICGDSRNLIEILSLRVTDLINASASDKEHLRKLFVAARTDAGGSLEAIYQQVKKVLELPIPIDKLIELEIETERDMIVPIIATRKLIDGFRSKGRILFISDMYLPSSFLCEILKCHGFFKDGDLIFVSDEIGAWKRDGSLFNYIHEVEGIPFGMWHHYGDNIHSDINVPKKIGIHTHHIHYDFLPYEKSWNGVRTTKMPVHSIVAGISRAVRLQYFATDDQKNFVCDVTAPLIVTWTISIMSDAVKKGIKRLYFCSRDTHTEYLVAKSLTHIFPSLEVYYLFISRESRDKSPLLFLKYLVDVKVASTTERVGIVDATTNGSTILKINQLLTKDGYLPCHGYFFLYVNIYANTPHQMVLLTQTIIMNLYTNRNRKDLYSQSTNTLFPEHIFSLNLHSRTIGYVQKEHQIHPVFGGDDSNIRCNDYKNYKKRNDQLVILWAKAFSKALPVQYSSYILDNIAMPTYGQFTYSPRKEYVGFLNNIQVDGKPMVALLTPINIIKKNYHWLRGCIAYTFPKDISSFLFRLLSSGFYIKVIKHQ